MTENGRPVYPADSSSSETWEHESLRSSEWAAQARETARKYHRRQMLLGYTFLIAAIALLIAVITLIVLFAIELSQR